MTEDIRLYPFPMTNREQVEAVRERLAQKLTYKPTAEVNFAKAHLPIISIQPDIVEKISIFRHRRL